MSEHQSPSTSVLGAETIVQSASEATAHGLDDAIAGAVSMAELHDLFGASVVTQALQGADLDGLGPQILRHASAGINGSQEAGRSWMGQPTSGHQEPADLLSSMMGPDLNLGLGGFWEELPGGADGAVVDQVGIWGLNHQVQRALQAGAFVDSAPDAGEAEQKALQTTGATVILPSKGEIEGFSVFVLESPDAWTEFSRDNTETLLGQSNVQASGGVHAFVTTDGYLLPAAGLVAVFDGDTIDLWEGGGAAALGDNPIPTFERALAATMEKFLSMARQGSEEQANRDPESAVPHARRLHELNTGIEAKEARAWELSRWKIPRGNPDPIPPTPEALAKASRLQREAVVLRSERVGVINQFPLLQEVDDLQAFVDTDAAGRQALLDGASVSVHVAVHNVTEALHRGDIDLWSLSPLVLGTLALLELDAAEPEYLQITQEMQARDRQGQYWEWAMVVIQLGAAVVGAVATGGLGAAAVAVGVSAGLIDAAWMTDEYLLDQDLAQLGSGDPAAALIDPSTLGVRGFFVALAWLGLGLDVMDVFKAVGSIRKLFGKTDDLEAAVRALAGKLKKDPDALLAAMRSADGLKVSDEHLVVLQSQLGVKVVVSDDLGKGAQLFFGKDGWSPSVLRVGPEAQLFEVLAHKMVIDSCRRYDGISGRLLKAWDHLGGSGPIRHPEGSAAWAAHAELGKLNTIIDNLYLRASQAIDPALGADLQRQAAFLESRSAHFEQVMAGLVAESDPRFIARMTQQTQEAYKAKMPRFEDVQGIDAQNYWYRSNGAGPPPYTVYHSQNATKRLELVADGDASGGYRLAEAAAKKPAHVFAAGTTKLQALNHLVGGNKSFGPYREMLNKFGIADDSAILAAMIDPVGVSEDTLRHLLKSSFREAVLERMFVESGTSLSKEKSIEVFQEMTRGLNSSDAGNLGESWFQRWSKQFNDTDLEGHPSFLDSDGKKRLPDFIERGGTLEGGTAVEVKATKVGLNAGHDLPQIRETCKLAKAEGEVLVSGQPVTVKQVRLVFLHDAGARGSLDALDDLFVDFGSVLSVEVFFASGSQTFSDLQSLKKALQ